jgi:hypothetical protein
MSPVRILSQPMPLARSILWAPTSATRPSDVALPVFLQQSALQAIYEHLTTLPPAGQGILGFLLGDRCECPVSGVSYCVIDAALRLNQTIYGDRSRDVITRLWKRLEAQLEAQQAHLLGWYHTHAPLPLELSVHDVDTHEQYFSEPWQVGILLGTDAATPAGALFRAGVDEAWVRTPQQFYELLNEDSVRPDGKKRSFMTWKTYRAYNPPALQPRAGAGAARGTRAPAPTPPREAPRPVEERDQQPEPEEAGRDDPSGMENMPQAELEEPRPTELQEPEEEQEPEEQEQEEQEQEEQEEEWEDPGALKFLSAAEDSPPPLPSRSAASESPFLPPPLPLPPMRSAEPPLAPPEPVPSDAGPSSWEQEQAPETELAEEVPEPSEPPPPERRARRRRGSRGWVRKFMRAFAFGLVGLLVVAGGVVAWPFVPGLLQRLNAVAPWRHTAASDNPHPAAARPAAAPPAVTPRAVAPQPALIPRPEFALLDQAGDSLARALRAYNGRAHLFDKRALDCPVLGRGLVRVERAVATYGVQHNATRATLDPSRVARDRELRAGVDSAGRQFQRSQCEHP